MTNSRPQRDKRLIGALLMASAAVYGSTSIAQDWEYTAEIYGWMPNIDVQEEGGQSVEITLDDIVDNLDFGAMLALQARKGKWSFSNDLIFMDLVNKPNDAITPLLKLKKLELEAWIVTPTIGYNVFASETDTVDIVVGARYLWLDLQTELQVLPDTQLEQRVDTNTSDSNWDAIIGVRGNHRISDNWYLPYGVNGGTGQSDYTFQANAAFAYEFEKLDAVFGWRYMTWDIGGEIDELTVNGPFVGAILRF